MTRALGQVAYEAYRENRKFQEGPAQLALPPWDELTPVIQNAWTAAAVTVGDHVMNKTVDSVGSAAREAFEDHIRGGR